MKFKLGRKSYLALTIAGWFLFIGFAIFKIDEVKTRPIISELIVSAFLIQLSVMNFIWNWYKRQRPTLLDWFRLSTFLAVVYSYFKLIDKFDGKIDLVYGSQYLNRFYILPSLLVVLCGLATLFISENLLRYIIKKRESIRNFSNTSYEIRSKAVFYPIVFIVLGIQAYLLITGKVGYGAKAEDATGSFSFLQQIFLSLSTFIFSALAIFKYSLNEKSRTLNFTFYFYFACQILLGLLSGMKGNVIYTFVIVLIPFLFSGRIVPKKYIIIAVIPALLLYPLMDNYRDTLRDFPKLSKEKSFGLALGKTFGTDLTSNISSGGDKYTSRMEMFPALLTSVELEPQWKEYKDMTRYIYIPVSFFPRVIIPGKPIADTGEKLNYMISGLTGSSQTPTTFGWAYLEGGYVYVVLSFLIFAIFICFLEFKIGADSLLGLLIYISLIITLFVVEHDIYFILSKILQNLVVYYFFYKLLFREKQKVKT